MFLSIFSASLLEGRSEGEIFLGLFTVSSLFLTVATFFIDWWDNRTCQPAVEGKIEVVGDQLLVTDLWGTVGNFMGRLNEALLTKDCSFRNLVCLELSFAPDCAGKMFTEVDKYFSPMKGSKFTSNSSLLPGTVIVVKAIANRPVVAPLEV